MNLNLFDSSNNSFIVDSMKDVLPVNGVLEHRMRDVNGGANLDDMVRISNIKEDYLRMFVPYFLPSREELIHLAEQLPDIDKPSAMLVKDSKELKTHIDTAYQISHMHYVLAKKSKLKSNKGRDFPFDCCGKSSRNLTYSFMDFGYFNATYAYAHTSNGHKIDHGYVILPFILEGARFMGSIVVDPTLDQFYDPKDKPKNRNRVFVVPGFNWTYTASNKDNMHPQYFMSIPELKNIVKKGVPDNAFKGVRFYRKGANGFFNDAFSNFESKEVTSTFYERTGAKQILV